MVHVMSEVKVYGVAKSALWDSIGNPACFSSETMVVLKPDFDAQRLRADTAERALANCNLALKAQTFNFETQKAKVAAAEQRIAELLQICRDIQDDPRLWLMVRAELSGRIAAALNPNPEAESHE